MKTYKVESIADIANVANQILKDFSDSNVFALQGDLGAGKTAMVKAFVKSLKVDDDVSSPTFSLINEYGTKPIIYHFDLYRLMDLNEVIQIGFEDYIDSGNYCFIEWPEKITMLLPPERSKLINIVVESNNFRTITIEEL
jgi:tRNA threonylcarbamoyladenosine biosynthesis protein TsaE